MLRYLELWWVSWKDAYLATSDYASTCESLLQGRLIDLLRNTPGVSLDDVAVLVLDEADRLLEMGFTEEVGGWRQKHGCRYYRFRVIISQ